MINASILVKMACIYKYEYEGTTNMMVRMVKKVNYNYNVKKVNYNEDNSVCSIEMLQCPPRGATKDNLYVDISAAYSAFNPNYCIRVTDVLEREMRPS